MKRVLRTALLVLLLSVVGMDEGYAQTLMYTFDFSEVCSTGQTLYYKITDEANHHVELVAPGYYYHFDEDGGWNGKPWYWKNYQRPVGDLVVPAQVWGYSVV